MLKISAIYTTPSKQKRVRFSNDTAMKYSKEKPKIMEIDDDDDDDIELLLPNDPQKQCKRSRDENYEDPFVDDKLIYIIIMLVYIFENKSFVCTMYMLVYSPPKKKRLNQPDPLEMKNKEIHKRGNVFINVCIKIL